MSMSLEKIKIFKNCWKSHYSTTSWVRRWILSTIPFVTQVPFHLVHTVHMYVHYGTLYFYSTSLWMFLIQQLIIYLTLLNAIWFEGCDICQFFTTDLRTFSTIIKLSGFGISSNSMDDLSTNLPLQVRRHSLPSRGKVCQFTMYSIKNYGFLLFGRWSTLW